MWLGSQEREGRRKEGVLGVLPGRENNPVWVGRGALDLRQEVQSTPPFPISAAQGIAGQAVTELLRGPRVLCGMGQGVASDVLMRERGQRAGRA